MWPWNLTDDLEKQKGTSPKQHQAICIISSSYVNLNWSYSPETVKLGVDLCDLVLWPQTLTFCMAVTIVIGNNCWQCRDDTMMGTWWKRCDGGTDWTSHIAAWSQLKTIGHLFYATSGFVQHFIAIGEFKLESQSGNGQSESNSTIFSTAWPWNLTDDLENNRAPLLNNIKLYVAFHHHRWIQTGVTVRKRLSWVVTSVTLTFDL